jgi:hypothetical protein
MSTGYQNLARLPQLLTNDEARASVVENQSVSPLGEIVFD